MGGEGSIAGMIISMRNNANLRLGRKKYFTKDNPYLNNKNPKKRAAKRVKRSPQQIQQFRLKQKARKKRELMIQVVAFVVAATIAVILVYLFFGTSLFSNVRFYSFAN